MKFILAVVILALAVCSEAGYLPAAVVDVSHGAWGSPWAAGPYWGAPAWGGPSLTTSHSWGAPYAPYAYGGPYAAAAYGPTTAYHADPLPHGHDGKYVAANRGSVHVAPLVGHVQSVSSTNLSPAPGTTW
ncbi:adult cuticle protein 1-like [Sitodiplosis mosellana]|uniref:adult cuticle protein 1-like n=1 Tax=Sitodiplosis mosellana TaxID=263140 RepID=UPI0024442A76|nr:adult cuticle protein 1-like [Sitodiplosis mosellana]